VPVRAFLSVASISALIAAIVSALLVVTAPVNQPLQKFSLVKIFLQVAEYNAPEKLVTSPRIPAPVKIRELR
jgi:hypothetical protein